MQSTITWKSAGAPRRRSACAVRAARGAGGTQPQQRRQRSQRLAPLHAHHPLRTVASAFKSMFAFGASTAEFEEVDESMEEGIELIPVSGPEALDEESTWLAGMLKLWLDEEWGPQPAHANIGSQAAEHYRVLRLGGETDLGSVVLGLSSHLLSVDFNDSFVNGFEVANKVSEILMVKMGREVCCVSAADLKLADRYAALVAKEAGDPK